MTHRECEAALVLSIAASQPAWSMDHIAAEVISTRHSADVLRVARRALAAACANRDHTSAEARAEAEALLRTGWM